MLLLNVTIVTSMLSPQRLYPDSIYFKKQLRRILLLYILHGSAVRQVTGIIFQYGSPYACTYAEAGNENHSSSQFTVTRRLTVF